MCLMAMVCNLYKSFRLMHKVCALNSFDMVRTDWRALFSLSLLLSAERALQRVSWFSLSEFHSMSQMIYICPSHSPQHDKWTTAKDPDSTIPKFTRMPNTHKTTTSTHISRANNARERERELFGEINDK